MNQRIGKAKPKKTVRDEIWAIKNGVSLDDKGLHRPKVGVRLNKNHERIAQTVKTACLVSV